MALIIKILINSKEMVELGCVNVTVSKYGKGMQEYEVYVDKEPQGIYIEHKFEDGYEKLSALLVSCWETLLVVPK